MAVVPARRRRDDHGGCVAVVGHRRVGAISVLLRVHHRRAHGRVHRWVVMLPGHHCAHGGGVVGPCSRVVRGDEGGDAACGAGIEHRVRWNADGLLVVGERRTVLES